MMWMAENSCECKLGTFFVIGMTIAILLGFKLKLHSEVIKIIFCCLFIQRLWEFFSALKFNFH